MRYSPAPSFTVVYRLGGSANFSWQRTVAFSTYAQAEEAAGDIRRGGRPAMVFKTSALDAIGLPETFEPGAIDTDTAIEAGRYAVAGNTDPNS